MNPKDHLQALDGIGIDVGKKELVLCKRSSNGLAEKPISFSNTIVGRKKILRYLEERAVGEDVPILLESTGPYHWKTAHDLEQAGYLSKVVNPLHTRQILKYSIRKRKTDQIDASHLAFLASQGYGYRFQETEDMVKNKALVRYFWKLHKTKIQYILQEKYLREDRNITKAALTGCSLLPQLEKNLKRLEKQIIGLFRKGNDLKYLDSIPGISPLLAATLLCEIIPLERFQNIEQIIAYAGLDPQVKQSGGKAAHYGGLSKRGSPLLRHVLYLAAFGNFTKPPFSEVYQKHKKRGLHHTAVLCIIARKILRISFTLLKKRQIFDSDRFRCE